MDNFQQLQKIILDYFKDTDNQTIIGFIDSFVYHQGTSNKLIVDLIKKFLHDNGLEKAYANYMIDHDRKQRREEVSFYKASLSERTMIDEIKQALHNLAYIRFREIKPAPKPIAYSKRKVLGTAEVPISTHIVSILGNGDYSICGIDLEGIFFTGKTEPTDDKVDCPDCIAMVITCQHILL